MFKMTHNGIIKDLENSDYHAESEHLSSSKLKLLLTDLEKFHSENILKIKTEQKENTNFSEGSFVHSLILEPTKLDEYAFFEGWTKRGPEWTAFKEANEGKTILSKPQKIRCEKWVESYKKNPAAVELVSGIEAEISVFTELDGVRVKARADGLNLEKGYILDVKTTSYSPSLESFKLVCEQFSYYLSAALYLKCFEIAYNKKFEFYFIVISKSENECQVYKLSEESKQVGDREMFEALRIYKKCKKSNLWTKEAKESFDYDNYEILEV